MVTICPTDVFGEMFPYPENMIFKVRSRLFWILFRQESTYGCDDGDTVEQSSRQAPLARLLNHISSLRLFTIVTVCFHLEEIFEAVVNLTSSSISSPLHQLHDHFHCLTFMMTSISNALRTFSASAVQLAFHRTFIRSGMF